MIPNMIWWHHLTNKGPLKSKGGIESNLEAQPLTVQYVWREETQFENHRSVPRYQGMEKAMT